MTAAERVERRLRALVGPVARPTYDEQTQANMAVRLGAGIQMLDRIVAVRWEDRPSVLN